MRSAMSLTQLSRDTPRSLLLPRDNSKRRLTLLLFD
jgi:hypothetical protein